jgi:hypothetical protein
MCELFLELSTSTKKVSMFSIFNWASTSITFENVLKGRNKMSGKVEVIDGRSEGRRGDDMKTTHDTIDRFVGWRKTVAKIWFPGWI